MSKLNLEKHSIDIIQSLTFTTERFPSILMLLRHTRKAMNFPEKRSNLKFMIKIINSLGLAIIALIHGLNT